MGRPPLEVSRATLGALQAHTWPGNVRELENAVERAVIVSRGKWAEISVDGPPAVRLIAVSPSAEGVVNGGRRTLEDHQRDDIIATLEGVHWRVEGQGGAAEALGMNANTLRSRMRKLGIRRPGSAPAAPRQG